MVMMIINIFNIFMLEMQITLKGWKHWGVVRKSRVWNLPRWDLKEKWIVPLAKRGEPDCGPRGMARVHRTDVDGHGYLPGVTRLPPAGWQELPPMQGRVLRQAECGAGPCVEKCVMGRQALGIWLVGFRDKNILSHLLLLLPISLCPGGYEGDIC